NPLRVLLRRFFHRLSPFCLGLPGAALRPPRACPESIGGCCYVNVLRPCLLPRSKLRPRSCLHIPQQRLLPRILGMLLQKICSQEIRSARMSSASDKAHLARQLAVGSFALHRSSRIVSIPPP